MSWGMAGKLAFEDTRDGSNGIEIRCELKKYKKYLTIIKNEQNCT